jgi:lipopolysaccharide export system permease protein
MRLARASLADKIPASSCHLYFLTAPNLALGLHNAAEPPTIRGRVKTLHTYLTHQVLATLLMTVAVFTFVLLLGNVLKEILALLVNRQASLGLVVRAMGLLIPFVWVFALPMGMLTATLLVFGRFSADQELTAVRASGVSLVSLVSPILLLSVALCGLSALVNMEIAPRCRVAYKSLLANVDIGIAKVLISEGSFRKDFDGYIYYIGKSRGTNLQDVMIFRLKDQTNIDRIIRAPSGTLQFDRETREVILTLHDSSSVTLSTNGIASPWMGDFTTRLKQARKGSSEPSTSDLTFGQLWERRREMEQSINRSARLDGLTRAELLERKKELRKTGEAATTPYRVQIHEQVSFSFACFGFTLVGIPLGIRVHRRETNIGIFMALALVFVYYSFVMVAKALDTRPEYAPHLIVWFPNFLFQAVGAVLLWRANKGF